jgi:PAS domain S-box-containing protein
MAKTGSSKVRTSRKGMKGSPKAKVKRSGDSSGPATGRATSLLNLPTTSRFTFWQLNVNSRRIKWSGNSARYFGLRNNQSLPATNEEMISWIHKDDRESFRDALYAATSKGSEFAVECRVFVPNENYKWMLFSGAPVFASAKLKQFSGILQDVTIQKLTELELKDWKTRNELVSESAGLLIYDYDLATGEIIWSGNSIQLVGYTSAEMGRIELWEELIHPDDRTEANRLLEISKKQLKPYDVYYRFKRKGKGYCYVHDRGQFIPNAQGEAYRMLGVMNDVSERIEADKTIQRSEKSYRELFNSVGQAIYIQKLDGTFVDVNQGAVDMYGYDKDEFIGKTPAFLSAPGMNDIASVRYYIEQAHLGKPQSFRWWGKKKSGEVFIKDVNLTRGSYFGDDIIIATAWDITEKIAAEQTLQESEKRFRRLIEDLNVGVMLLGPGLDVQIANKKALALLDVREDALMKKDVQDKSWKLITDDGGPFLPDDRPWALAVRHREPVRGVVLGIERTDSRVIWLLVNAEPTKLEDGTLINVVITLTDITERKNSEEALKESELRFRTLQQASFGGIGLHNKGVIIDCNQGLCTITGYSYEELIGSNGLNLIAPEFRDLVYNKIISKSEDPYDVEGIRKDGSRYYLEIHGKNIPYKEGLIRVTEFRDITERKAAESKILEQNAKLVAVTEDMKVRNEQLREFTQIVSHNLRSPVGNILSLLNFIENAETVEERLEYLNLLKEAGSTTLTTLQELTEVLQIKQNKNIEKQVLEFEKVFANVRRMLVAKIVEVDASITTDFSAAPTIEYPNIYLESIILNLLSNALKYTLPDRKPEILIRSFDNGRGTCMSVTDNGAGLNMKRYGHHIFRLRKTFHKHPESRGIGLFMIKNQIEAMGGDITMTSVENQGSTFLVNFSSRNPDDEF